MNCRSTLFISLLATLAAGLMPPILKEVKEQFKEHVRIIKVNVDHFPEIATSCEIRNIPTVVVFLQGKIQWSGKGVQGTSDISIALKELL